MPEASKLALIRQNIDRNSQRLKDILMHPDVRGEILGGVPNDEKKVIKAFVNQNKESALKTRPKVGRLCSRLLINLFRPGLSHLQPTTAATPQCCLSKGPFICRPQEQREKSHSYICSEISVEGLIKEWMRE